jgi:hypothetical protein
MNKQPFYHRAVILFTATEGFGVDDVTKIFQSIKRSKNIIVSSIECEEVDAEPGDPQDLM